LVNVAIAFSNCMKLVAKLKMRFYSKVRVDISKGISIYDVLYPLHVTDYVFLE